MISLTMRRDRHPSAFALCDEPGCTTAQEIPADAVTVERGVSVLNGPTLEVSVRVPAGWTRGAPDAYAEETLRCPNHGPDLINMTVRTG